MTTRIAHLLWRTRFRGFTLCVIAPLIGCDGGMSVNDAFAAAPMSPDPGVAVVEMFTSEGCSSCPPAEKVLGDIADAATKSGRPIFTLAFHVDYWNNLGWTDPFSNAPFSVRQSMYSKHLKLDEVYTPQIVVNGRTQFVGSDTAAASKVITEALATPASAKVAVSVARKENGTFTLHYAVTHAGPAAVVNVAVVEQGLSSHVQRGENSGRDLHDPSVVRWFTAAPLDGDGGSVDVSLPSFSGVTLDHASIVVYVQRNEDWSVIGAASSRFP